MSPGEYIAAGFLCTLGGILAIIVGVILTAFIMLVYSLCRDDLPGYRWGEDLDLFNDLDDVHLRLREYRSRQVDKP